MPSDTANGLAKAELSCLDDSAQSITVQFNPTSFKLGRSVTWSDQSVALQPWGTLQYATGNSDTMSLSLLLDASESAESVLPAMEAFYGLTMPMQVSAEVLRPPVVLFKWEEFRFLGVVRSVDVDVLLFDATGRPKRATVSLGLLGRAFAEAASPDEFFSQNWEP